MEHGLASKNDLIKILGRGVLSTKVTISANAYTATAKKAIEDNGGEAVIL